MGPAMSSLPVRQIPGSGSADGHCSFLQLRELLSIGVLILLSRQPGYLLLSVVSATAASMMRSEGKW